MNRPTIFLLAFSLSLISSCTSEIIANKNKVFKKSAPNAAKNVIFMIVDGMGFEHVKAARIFNGQQPLSFERFPCKTKVTTCSIDGADKEGKCIAGHKHTTESAAAATAIATGTKVSNGVISKRIKGDQTDLETILEIFQRQGRSTGIIATKLFTDATPAAFASHARDRSNTKEILQGIFEGTVPNVVLGADTNLHRKYAAKAKAPYVFAHTAKTLDEAVSKISRLNQCQGNRCHFLYGGFGQYHMIPGAYKNKSGLPLEVTPQAIKDKLGTPSLSHMTDAALKVLSLNNEGFFLMVESSMPDMISHYNTQIDANEKSPDAITALVAEMLEVENTIRVLRNFVDNNPDTLLVVTADHETGGLFIDEEKTTCLGEKQCIPKVKWTSKKYEPNPKSPARHTNADVPLYAVGFGSKRYCQPILNNTDIQKLALNHR